METRSLRYIYGEASAAVRRFPLAAAFCAAACVAALFYALALVNERFPLPAPAAAKSGWSRACC